MAVHAALEPSDLLNKHAWLFCNGWVEESFDEIENIGDVDFRIRDERIRELRIDALSEIFTQRVFQGFWSFLSAEMPHG